MNLYSPHAQSMQSGDATTQDIRSSSFIVFRIDTQFFALPLAAVSRVLRMVALTPIPDAPPWVLGMVNQAGHVLPALSLRRRLGLPDQEPGIHHRLLVTAKALWVVDEVLSVLELPPERVEPPPSAAALSRCLAGSFQDQDRLVLLLDPEGLQPEGGLQV